MSLEKLNDDYLALGGKLKSLMEESSLVKRPNPKNPEEAIFDEGMIGMVQAATTLATVDLLSEYFNLSRDAKQALLQMVLSDRDRIEVKSDVTID